MTEDDRLPLPGFVEWPNFPFEGDLRVQEVRPFSDVEAPRNGEPGGGECVSCKAADDQYIWTNERWRLKTLAPFTPLPLLYILETRKHIDMHQLDDDLASELGRISVNITRTGEAQPEIGRVHNNRWGDGGEHFHYWYLGRPMGAEQLGGFTLPMWGFILPPIPTEVTDPITEKVVASLERMT